MLTPFRTAAAVGLCAVALASGQVASAQRPQISLPVIVVFQDTAPFDLFSDTYRPDDRAQGDPDAWGYLNRGVAGMTQALERAHGFRAQHVYSHAVRGFSGRLTARQIADLEDDYRVAYVELDGEMSANAQTLPWGIDKIDADISTALAGNGSGTVTGVTAYIIDSGIDTKHRDLTVTAHVNFAGGKNVDCNGHGTHVAGTVAAKDDTNDVVGVAPGAALVGVKVLGCSGSGSTSGVIKGVDYVTANATPGRSVANMSLGGGVSQALDDAVIRSAQAGIVYAIAAGNSGADACSSSPARAGVNAGIITTAATASNETEASFSNYGACVDIWAPGVSILSTKRAGGTTTMSGTSMASPHVAGAAALVLWNQGVAMSPDTVEQWLKGAAVMPGTTSKDGRVITRLSVGGF